MKSVKLFKGTLDLLTKNWWLKLIALLLAIVIYHGEKTDQASNSNGAAHERPIIQFR